MNRLDFTVDTFNSVEFFKGLTPAQMVVVKPIFLLVEAPAGSLLFEQDSPADYLYIVVEGEVVVNFKPDDGPSIVVTRAHTGEVVGWSAALSSRTYTSSASASTDSRLLRVRGHNLRKVCRRHPDIRKLVQECLAAVIVQRVSKTHAQVVALLELSLGGPNEP